MSIIKHTDPILDDKAVNQDKKNMLFSVSCDMDFVKLWVLMGSVKLRCQKVLTSELPNPVWD
jgi:hypothetical protein